MRRINRNVYITIPYIADEDFIGNEFCYYTGDIIPTNDLPLQKIDLEKDLVITTKEDLQKIKKLKFVNVYTASCDQIEFIINTW